MLADLRVYHHVCRQFILELEGFITHGTLVGAVIEMGLLVLVGCKINVDNNNNDDDDDNNNNL